MMSILVPIAAVTIIGLICAVGLSVASALLAVKEDERFPAIRECLPGANCGACGYSGCDGYAKALLKPGTKTNLCVPGADTVAAKYPMYVVRALGGLMFLAGACIMAYNLWMTVKAAPAKVQSPAAVPAE